MTTRLAKLMDELAPQRTIQEVLRRVDIAINSFRADNAQITDWETFRQCIIRFARHVTSRVLGGVEIPETDVELAWGHWSKVLLKAYGANGEKAAFEYARTGVEGGLLGVLRRFALKQAEQYIDAEIAGRVSVFWTGLTMSEKFAVMDEYLAQYGDLLPSEMTEHGAARLKMDFPGVLRMHPRMILHLQKSI